MVDKEYIQNNLITKTGMLNSNRMKDIDIQGDELFCIYHEINYPLCGCGEKLRFESFRKGFFKYCGKRCWFSKREALKKTKSTNLDKYGVEHTSKLDSTKLKSKETSLKKFGKTHHMKTTTGMSKFKQSMKMNHGVEFSGNSEELLHKSKQTCLQKYGVEFSFQSQNNKDKSKQTCLQKYGVSSFTKTHFFTKKYKESSMEKHGVEFYQQRNITNYENYNEEFTRSKFIKGGFFDFERFCEYFNITPAPAYIKKASFGIIEPNKTDKHKTQNEIYDYIRSLGVSISQDNREIIHPLEIDLLSHEHKFGIEFNGLMFHSQGTSKYPMFNTPNFDPKYHLKKTEKLEEKGYQLFHIFENEWCNAHTRDIWKSVISAKVGRSRRVFARKTEVREVKHSQAMIFLEENHLQGSVNSNLNLGLFNDNELICIMTFGKSRFKKGEYELYRMCNKKFCTVVGGFSKLLKYFERNYNIKRIISFANRRWSIGNVYEVNGFEFVNYTGVNYFYFKDTKLLESRNTYQKHKLKDVLETFDENKTEPKNMFDNGYRRIFDSGNMKFMKEFS